MLTRVLAQELWRDDISVNELFPTLARGATLLLRDDAMAQSVTEFYRRCREWSITCLFPPTAFWHELAAAAAADPSLVPPSLRLVSFGGERVLADVNQCLDSTATIVWPMMRHLVVLEKEYTELPAVHCYPMQLKQIFMNLLVNAYQAIEEKLGDSGQTGTIRLRTEPRGSGVLVEVSDTGAGIPPDQLDRIFDPFFTTKKVGAGTGLGLSTSYNIAQRHGGTIRVESVPGKGTTFRVLLPVGRAGDEAAA